MSWILIITIYATGLATAEFKTQDACITAGEAAKAAYEETGPLLNPMSRFAFTCNQTGP
jgi:hypothetical protein